MSVTGEPAILQRLYELGVMEGEMIEFVATAPLGDPLEIRLGKKKKKLDEDDVVGVQVSPR